MIDIQMDRVTRYDEYMSCSMQLKTIFLQNGKKENVWIVGILVLTFLEIPF